MLIILLFFFSLFLGGKRKGEKNNQNRGQKSCLSARSKTWTNIYFCTVTTNITLKEKINCRYRQTNILGQNLSFRNFCCRLSNRYLSECCNLIHSNISISDNFHIHVKIIPLTLCQNKMKKLLKTSWGLTLLLIKLYIFKGDSTSQKFI